MTERFLELLLAAILERPHMGAGGLNWNTIYYLGVVQSVLVITCRGSIVSNVSFVSIVNNC